MTELATTTNNAGVEVIPAAPPSAVMAALSGDAMARLDQEMALMDRIYRYAQQLCSSEFVPDIYRNKPENGAAAMQYGATFGLSGMAALQNVFLVKGKPSTFARIMYAAATAAGHEMWEEPGASDDEVTWHGRKRGDDKIFTTTWTPARVKQAGYDSNARYRTNPVEMMRAKCQAEVARYVAPEILAGMPYSREELEMESSKPVRVRAERGGRGVGGLRAAISAPPVTSDSDSKPDNPQVDRDASQADQLADGMTATARRKWLNRMFALLDEGDCADRDDQLIVLNSMVGPGVEHRDQLSDDWLRAVVNQLTIWSKNSELGQQITDILNASSLAEADAETTTTATEQEHN